MTRRSRVRLFVLQVLVLSLLATLLGRLWFLQVQQGPAYARAASANRVREVVTPAPRGAVYDITGTRLVGNRTALVVSVNRALLGRSATDRAAVLARLSRIVGTPVALLTRQITPCGATVRPPCWRGSPYQPVPVREYAGNDPAGLRKVLALQEQRENFPGVELRFEAVRQYDSPDPRRAAHVLGYLGPITPQELADPAYAGVQPTGLVGRSGVEATYDRALRGTDGVQRLFVDHVGAVTGVQSAVPPRPGDALVLSLDASVQAVAEQALQHAIVRARAAGSVADSGSVVVMEARTGRLVALASSPSYDPSVFIGGVSQQQYASLVGQRSGAPLLFRAVQGSYPPGSTFKVISTAAAVMDGFPLDGRYACPGSYAPLGGKRNFEGEVLGTLSLRTAISKSCDTVFYDIAYRQWLRDGGLRAVAHPKDPMIRMARAFGLGRRTGVDLPGERSGTIPDRRFLAQRWTATKDEYCKGARDPAFPAERRQADAEFCTDGYAYRGGDAANLAIGQGDTSVTPLQMAVVYAAIANGGTLVQPTLARALLSADGTTVREVRPVVRGRLPVRPEVLSYLRGALGEVTTSGTAAGAFAGFGLHVAGKTGTAEVAHQQDSSWFASFAPVEHPDLVVVGMINQGGQGALAAAPMVREVYAGIYGLDGRSAALPGGRLPTALPVVRPDGTVGPPGTRVPQRPRVSAYVREAGR